MHLLQELSQTVRAIVRQPGLALLSVIALGLGIGLPTAMFSLVDGAVLRGLPVADAGRIMHLERRRIGASGEGIQAHARDYVAWKEQQRSFEQLAAFSTQTMTLRSEQGADRWNAAFITPNTFEVLRVRAALGRAFNAQDEAAAAQPVVLLGHAIWRDRFASDRSVLGRTVHIDGQPHTVVGVMPEDFRFPGGEDLWVPLKVGASQCGQCRVPDHGRLRPVASGCEPRASAR